MDTWYYELEYDDETYDFYFANIIPESLYSRVDSEGHQFLVLEYISNNWSDGTAITVAYGFIIIRCGKKHPKKTTCEWELLTQMKEGFFK